MYYIFVTESNYVETVEVLYIFVTESSYVEVCVLMRTDSLGEMIEISEPNKVYITTKLEKKAHVGNIM